MHEGLFVLAGGALLAGTIGAAVVAHALRIPALVLFLVIGMAAGSDGAGLIRFGDYDVARQIGTLALSVILFEGGLSGTIAELRPVARPAVALAVGGTILTAVLTGVAACVLLGLDLLDGLLVGAILASTDGAAVFALLRGSRLPGRLVRTLEGEAGLNDPVAVLLVVGLVDWRMHSGYGMENMLSLFVTELTIGAAAGVGIGLAGAALVRRATLPSLGLYPVLTIAIGAIAYGAADSLHGSGFLAVYLAGLCLSGMRPEEAPTIATFHHGMAWLAQVTLFLTLGLLAFPAQLGAALVPGTLLAVFVACVARPLAVTAVTATEPFTPSERVLLSWAGLRGGVPVVLATLPVVAGVPGSARFFDVVFVVVVLSTLVQGMTMEPLARALGLLGGGPLRLEQLGWSAAHGDPAHPVALAGSTVVEHLLVRPDAAAALVVLGDGRYAITGPTVALGPREALRGYADERLLRAGADAADRAWWGELAATLRRPRAVDP